MGIYNIAQPTNEPVRDYAPLSTHRASLKAALEKMAAEEVDVPLFIGDQEVRTGKLGEITMPHNHSHKLGVYHKASAEHVQQAIAAAMKASRDWAHTPWEDRAAIFLKAAELSAGSYRNTLNGATMLGQSKTAYQAEIDSACELIDFLRFNVYFMEQIYREQPISGPGVWNRSDYRPLEGYVFAVTPFNFTAIAGNLPTAPAMMGNVVLWKPASSALYSAYFIMRLLQTAGLPPGVINLVAGSGGEVGDPAVADSNLAGLHFTGSTEVFQDMWSNIGINIKRYRTYPRIVGETGGKDFVLAHPSADPHPLATALIRGAFEYQGQKCSAASRAYIPSNLWPEVKAALLSEVDHIKMGDVRDFRNFMGAVIDKNAFRRISGYIKHAQDSDEATILAGGTFDDREGWFIRPTVVEVDNPYEKLMEEEIFGPVLTLYVYEETKFDEILDVCESTSPYALTGALWAQDRAVISQATRRLRNAAGNFYINDKPTGAVVGQQPFGGARGSGTNDKAGSALNLLRWISARSIKETFEPPSDYRYPFMEES
ncbi:L-glutamate gamma-semialdehyde dehydrogenase [bacterium CPR1]|nr:L-glutamate gamma-semialdehyde dehydrogenase [bacterium CPR1]